MLTTNDFSKLKKLIREEVEAEGENTRSETSSEIKLAGIRTTQELQEVNNRLKSLEIRSKRIKKDTQKIKKDLDITIKFFDKTYLKLAGRMAKVEGHLGFPEPAII